MDIIPFEGEAFPFLSPDFNTSGFAFYTEEDYTIPDQAKAKAERLHVLDYFFESFFNVSVGLTQFNHVFAAFPEDLFFRYFPNDFKVNIDKAAISKKIEMHTRIQYINEETFGIPLQTFEFFGEP